MKILLAYYSQNRSRFPGIKALADCEARITRTQIIVTKSEVRQNDHGLRCSNRHKFRRKDGRTIPHFTFVHTWELADGELGRINKIEAESTEAMERDLRAHGDPI